MALTKVQSTAKVAVTNSFSISFTLSTIPIVGNGLVVLIGGAIITPLVTPTCTDNKGNVYELAARAADSCYIFLCKSVTTSSATFTITATLAGGLSSIHGNVVEISGAVGGLELTRSITKTGSSTTPNVGPTTTIPVNNVFVTALFSIGVNQASITVESVSPSWDQEWEQLTGVGQQRGEADSRILTTASGTTQSCSWVVPSTGGWNALYAAFASFADIPPQEIRITQDIVETLSLPVPAIRVTQDVVETLSSPFPAIRTTQYVVELLSTVAVIAPPASTETTQFLIVM